MNLIFLVLMAACIECREKPRWASNSTAHCSESSCSSLSSNTYHSTDLPVLPPHTWPTSTGLPTRTSATIDESGRVSLSSTIVGSQLPSNSMQNVTTTTSIIHFPSISVTMESSYFTTPSSIRQSSTISSAESVSPVSTAVIHPPGSSIRQSSTISSAESVSPVSTAAIHPPGSSIRQSSTRSSAESVSPVSTAVIHPTGSPSISSTYIQHSKASSRFTHTIDPTSSRTVLGTNVLASDIKSNSKLSSSSDAINPQTSSVLRNINELSNHPPTVSTSNEIDTTLSPKQTTQATMPWKLKQIAEPSSSQTSSTPAANHTPAITFTSVGPFLPTTATSRSSLHTSTLKPLQTDDSANTVQTIALNTGSIHNSGEHQSTEEKAGTIATGAVSAGVLCGVVLFVVASRYKQKRLKQRYSVQPQLSDQDPHHAFRRKVAISPPLVSTNSLGWG